MPVGDSTEHRDPADHPQGAPDPTNPLRVFCGPGGNHAHHGYQLLAQRGPPLDLQCFTEAAQAPYGLVPCDPADHPKGASGPANPLRMSGGPGGHLAHQPLAQRAPPLDPQCSAEAARVPYGPVPSFLIGGSKEHNATGVQKIAGTLARTRLSIFDDVADVSLSSTLFHQFHQKAPISAVLPLEVDPEDAQHPGEPPRDPLLLSAHSAINQMMGAAQRPIGDSVLPLSTTQCLDFELMLSQYRTPLQMPFPHQPEPAPPPDPGQRDAAWRFRMDQEKAHRKRKRISTYYAQRRDAKLHIFWKPVANPLQLMQVSP